MRTKACRTCNRENIESLRKLTSKIEPYLEKQLLDLLFELTGINAKLDETEFMPQRLCEKCVTRLKNAYDFVLQARQINNQFLEAIEEAEILKKTNNTDCLQEIPMDLCVEVEEENEELEDDIVAETPYVNDPLVEHKGRQLTREYKKKTSEDKLFKCNQCNKSFHWPQNLKLHMRQHSNEEYWLSCPHCSRKFYRNDTLRSHLKTHGDLQKRNYTWKTEKRRNMNAKSVDINMCKPHGCKLILCMLCQQRFLKIRELRYHLKNHPDIDNEQYLSLAENLFFDRNDISKDHFVDYLRNGMESGNLSLFCSITNQAGYELSLDSSDTDSESDDIATIEENKKYKCELCEADFERKYQVFQHQQQLHKWLDAPHVCSRCGGRFVCKQLLDHHQKSQCKNPQKRFICYKCPMRFNWKHNLKTHLKEHATLQTEVFECVECKRSFVDQKGLTVHMRTIHCEESNFMACQWCERKFYRRDRLVKHMLRHGFKEKDVSQAENLMAAIASANDKKTIQCKICNTNFNRIKDLRLHIRNCHDCDISASNYSITNLAGYELHIEDSDTDDSDIDDENDEFPFIMKYTCDLCNMHQNRKFETMQHQRIIHSFEKYPNQCEKCVFKCLSKDILDYHKRTQCFNTEKRYQCEICCYKFMWQENLVLHKKLQHSILHTENLNLGIEDTTKLASPKFDCPHCGKTYSVKGCLNNHIKDVHIDDNRKKKESQKKYLCSLCGFQTSEKSKLTIHTRVHTGEKPYKCDFCDKKFARRYQLDTHRRIHTGEKPFNCTECNKSFTRNDRLRKHFRVHMKSVEKENKKNAKDLKE